MENFTHSIVLSWDPEESVPPITGCFHGLKSKNLFSCVSTILFSNENYTIVKKTGTLNDVELNIILTYYTSREKPHENGFIRGYLYVNKKEHKIKSAYVYSSLQIGEWCYDNIQIVQLDTNIFE
jgi:hypothetical protein